MAAESLDSSSRLQLQTQYSSLLPLTNTGSHLIASGSATTALTSISSATSTFSRRICHILRLSCSFGFGWLQFNCIDCIVSAHSEYHCSIISGTYRKIWLLGIAKFGFRVSPLVLNRPRIRGAQYKRDFEIVEERTGNLKLGEVQDIEWNFGTERGWNLLNRELGLIFLCIELWDDRFYTKLWTELSLDWTMV